MFKRYFLTFIVIFIVSSLVVLYWSAEQTDEIFTKSIIYNVENIAHINFKDYDSVELSASDLYKADALKKVVQGEQYRAAWSAKIKVPIVYLDTLRGGMTIIKKGGGKQTHSLELLGNDGISYTLRSVNKDVNPLIPDFLKTLNLENIVVDGISSQHPYAAILVSELADKVDVLHTSPQLVFVPKQKTLGKFNEAYGNRLFLLEYESKSKVNYTHLNDIIEITDTDNLQKLKLQLRDTLHVDTKALVRSRLFDLLIGDWDRHAKQWAWAVKKEVNGYKAVPIAGDRDNAFFDVDGVIPKILSNKYVVKELRPFEHDIDFMAGLVYPFDVYFLKKTSEKIFIEEAEDLQTLLTDQLLQESLLVWPKNIRDLDGTEIIDKIKDRRDNLKSYAKEFYSIIQKKETIVSPLKGSEDLDLSKEFLSCFECK